MDQEHLLPMGATRSVQALPGGAGQRLLTLLASDSPKRRTRLFHWLIASLVYSGIALLLVVGVQQGWMQPGALAAWCAFVGLVLAVGYMALRRGWSERFADPAMTMWQLSMGVIAVNWGYLIFGPMRTSALFPLMVVFIFAAFSLRFRQIVWVTLFALACLAAAVVARQLLPHWFPSGETVVPLLVDVNNLLMIVVVLPAFALIAARLSALRKKLHHQRAALADALSAVERIAVSDELTGLPNRRAMLGALMTSITHARRGTLPVTIAMIDLDNFKQINDTLGHATGDRVLRGLADAARRLLRDGDLLGRWGGEEFLLVLPGAAPANAQQVLARIQAAVRDTLLDSRPVTFSAGVAAHQGAESAEALLARADAALYAAKRAGRDRVEVDAR